MSFIARRAATSALRTAARPSALPRATRSVRFNSSSSVPPPKASSNTGLYAALALAAIAGGGYWVYTSDSDTARELKTTAKEGAQVAKASTNFTPTQADYQKVYNKIASILEVDDYDGELFFQEIALLGFDDTEDLDGGRV